MNQKQFNEVHEKFEDLEKRGSFYDMALNLIDNGFDIEACILVLSTWNSSVFRYVVSTFDIMGFKKEVLECKRSLENLKDEKFEKVNFDSVSETIKEVYDKLSLIKGVKYTGASKLLHLMNRDLFVMWDQYIRKHYGFRKTSPDDYFNFLKKMQEEFKGIKASKGRTIAKLIDEYNYVSITLPALEKQRSKK